MKALFGVLLLVLAAGCAPRDDPSTLVVFAAASLSEVFTEIGQDFERDHPGVTVEFSFAGSADLVTQLTQGARADVFASADARNMARAAQAGLLAGDPVDFATNTLTIVVAPGNPHGINGFGDLARPGLDVVTCASQVPCGAATEEAERVAGVQLAPVSEESSVTDVLNKVAAGQADAGVVYVTDAKAAGDRVTSVPVPEIADVVNTYPIAALQDSPRPDLARQFVDAVVTGRELLDEAGFGRP
ncbi:molybdate ABC transporter substrate-binding protein [Mycolicibacterium flavescens]|uniref:Molybdate ABC transporter substrate-binding protein n=1 Tax=Mycolicibacterium flavescens TaxID=1776 RepID=A0A1E3RE64_MYCFV|nr:molybdate ABC transporter substrate-binding protein [Mycolicibacterium flavescens]MCV7282732.1 molybdate ABC transporter substrate-binding protein [Mycolicibacterium flavescens]ODQ88160.1 molybdate ABC transporter substrate-binding protein [Mycolicibacterium flavescens]